MENILITKVKNGYILEVDVYINPGTYNSSISRMVFESEGNLCNYIKKEFSLYENTIKE